MLADRAEDPRGRAEVVQHDRHLGIPFGQRGDVGDGVRVHPRLEGQAALGQVREAVEEFLGGELAGGVGERSHAGIGMVRDHGADTPQQR